PAVLLRRLRRLPRPITPSLLAVLLARCDRRQIVILELLLLSLELCEGALQTRVTTRRVDQVIGQLIAPGAPEQLVFSAIGQLGVSQAPRNLVADRLELPVSTQARVRVQLRAVECEE